MILRKLSRLDMHIIECRMSHIRDKASTALVIVKEFEISINYFMQSWLGPYRDGQNLKTGSYLAFYRKQGSKSKDDHMLNTSLHRQKLLSSPSLPHRREMA